MTQKLLITAHSYDSYKSIFLILVRTAYAAVLVVFFWWDVLTEKACHGPFGEASVAIP